ncbi:hypothetical protein [Dolichospermum phage Dfl-JY14]
MDNTSTPERTARELLAIVRAADTHANESMKIRALHSRYGSHRRHDELADGLRFAIEQGWLQHTDDRLSVRLTQAGFKEA